MPGKKNRDPDSEIELSRLGIPAISVFKTPESDQVVFKSPIEVELFQSILEAVQSKVQSHKGFDAEEVKKYDPIELGAFSIAIKSGGLKSLIEEHLLKVPLDRNPLDQFVDLGKARKAASEEGHYMSNQWGLRNVSQMRQRFKVTDLKSEEFKRHKRGDQRLDFSGQVLTKPLSR